MPRIVCGASAGSATLAVMCSRPYEKFYELSEYDVVYPDDLVPVVWKSKSILENLQMILNGEGVIDSKAYIKYVKHFTGDLTFEEIHDRFAWKLNINVTDYKFGSIVTPLLLNYLTAPNVVVWSAVQASSACPGAFNPVELMRKNSRGEIKPYYPSHANITFADGSMANDIPLERVKELFNVNTFIVSQVNPHVAPFVPAEKGPVLNTPFRRQFFKKCKALVSNNLTWCLSQLEVLGMVPSFLIELNTMANQTYSGHVTIVPDVKLMDYPHFLANPSREEYSRSYQQSYVQTLSKMAQIRAYFGIEREFNRYYERLRNELQNMTLAEIGEDFSVLDLVGRHHSAKDRLVEEEGELREEEGQLPIDLDRMQ